MERTGHAGSGRAGLAAETTLEGPAHQVWSHHAGAHRARLAPYVGPHLERRRLGVRHPVHDFLFTYYSYRPTQLLRWRAPGDLEAAKRPLAEATLRLLRATVGREGNLGCFGLHEWAMVYRDADTRHPQPLRLGHDGTDRVVEGHRIACSHKHNA